MKRGLVLPDTDKSLWPAPYDEATAEAAFNFITGHVWTFDESGGVDRQMPTKDYLLELSREWYKCMETGTPFHIVKSRRLVVSWWLAALELHHAGIQRSKTGIIAKTFEGPGGSKQFVWRTWYLYDQLRRRNPEWELPQAQSFGNPSRSELDKLVLENGSSFEPINSDGGTVRGSGFTKVRAEELSSYQYVAETWGQAKIICQGSPGQPNGFPYSVNNASPNQEFLDLIDAA